MAVAALIVSIVAVSSAIASPVWLHRETRRGTLDVTAKFLVSPDGRGLSIRVVNIGSFPITITNVFVATQGRRRRRQSAVMTKWIHAGSRRSVERSPRRD